jgi:hypothetical protein
MSDDFGRGYDREWTARTGQRIRRRFGYSHDRGEVERFVLQLEERLDGEWTPVVRYDHDEVTDHGGHDVMEEMAEQQAEIREALAEDPGGEPEDYSAERHFQRLDSDQTGEAVTDGGD